MSHIICSIYKCENKDDLIKGGECQFCGHYYLCPKHTLYTKHAACKRKIFYKVLYEDRCMAKRIGLFYDAGKKAWYASNHIAYNTAEGIFDRLDDDTE